MSSSQTDRKPHSSGRPHSPRSVSTATFWTGISSRLTSFSPSSRRSSWTRKIKIYSNRLISPRARKSSLLSTNGTWRASSTCGPVATANSLEVSSSPKESTQSATWTWGRVFSRECITSQEERSLLHAQVPLHRHMQIGSSVTTGSQTSSTNTEICEYKTLRNHQNYHTRA